MRTRTTSIFLSLAIVAAVLALGGPSQAAEGTTTVEHRISLFCDNGVTNGNGAFAYLGAQSSLLFGDSGFVQYWAPGISPLDDPPTLATPIDGVATVARDGSNITASIPLADSDGVVAPDASLTASFAPDGDPVIDESKSQGTQLVHFSGTFQLLSVTGGGLAMPDGQTFDLTGCTGEQEDSTRFEANPNALVYSFTGTNVGCSILDERGDLSFNANISKKSGTFAELFYRPSPEASFIEGATDVVTLTSGALHVSIPVHDESGPIGNVVVNAQLTVSRTVEFVIKNSSYREQVKATLYDVTGTIQIPGQPAIDMDGCRAITLSRHLVQSAPSGPPPKGPAPKNDLPSGAITLTPGSRATVPTAGAQADAEAQCLLPFEPDPLPADFGNTVWYKVVGTGATLTIDTAGSDFDTVMGVYTKNGADLIQEACVDDVPVEPIGNVLQARTSIPTAAGTDYYVQIGGSRFDGTVPYGVLKLSVS